MTWTHLKNIVMNEAMTSIHLVLPFVGSPRKQGKCLYHTVRSMHFTVDTLYLNKEIVPTL